MSLPGSSVKANSGVGGGELNTQQVQSTQTPFPKFECGRIGPPLPEEESFARRRQPGSHFALI